MSYQAAKFRYKLGVLYDELRAAQSHHNFRFLAESVSKGMAPLILGYTNVRGRANPIRYLLEHVDADYQMKIWDRKNPETNWEIHKFNLGLPFPNIPHLIDGDLKLTQTVAILKYLGRKYGLLAVTEEESQVQDMFDGILNDLYDAWLGLLYEGVDNSYPENFEEAKEKYMQEKAGPVLTPIDQWLAGKQFILGNELHYNDFVLFERLDSIKALFPDILNSFVDLKAYHQRMLSQKGVHSLLSSDRNPQAFAGPRAKWNGTAKSPP